VEKTATKGKARSLQEIIAKVGEIKGVGEKSAVQGVQVEDDYHKHKVAFPYLEGCAPLILLHLFVACRTRSRS